MKVINYEEFKRLLLEERKKIPLTAQGHAVQHVKHGIKIALRCLERCQDISTDLLFIAQPKWIPVTERLPQENEPVGVEPELVQVLLKDGSVTVGFCSRFMNMKMWFHIPPHEIEFEYSLFDQAYVIAWQPLSQPPKGDE